MSISILDFIEHRVEIEKRGVMTRDEFTEAMRSGDRARIDEAVERMYEAGGYENLE